MFTPSRPVPPLPGASLLGLKSASLLELGDAVEAGLPGDVLQYRARHGGMKTPPGRGGLGWAYEGFPERVGARNVSSRALTAA